MVSRSPLETEFLQSFLSDSMYTHASSMKPALIKRIKYGLTVSEKHNDAYDSYIKGTVARFTCVRLQQTVDISTYLYI